MKRMFVFLSICIMLSFIFVGCGIKGEKTDVQMQEKEKLIEEWLKYEYSVEFEKLEEYKKECEAEIEKASTKEEKEYYKKEIEKTNDKIKVFQNNEKDKMRTHLYEKARDIVWNKLLSKSDLDYNKLAFDDEDEFMVYTDEDGEIIIAYPMRIRVLTNDEHTYTYAIYAVGISTENIYEYDIVENNWYKLEI